MHKFWSWLGLNLGKHWITVMVIGAVLTVGLGYGMTKLRVLDGSGQLPQQERSGLQGQRRLPEPVRRRSHGHARDDGQGPHRRRAVHAREHQGSGRPSEKEIRDSGRVTQRREPAHRAAVERQARQEPRRRPGQQRRGQDPLGRAQQREDPRRAGKSRTDDAAKTLQPFDRDPSRRSARSPTRSTSTCCSTTTPAQSASRSSRSSPIRQPRARWSCACRATSRSHDEGKRGRLRAEGDERASALRQRVDDHDTGASEAAREPQRLPDGRHGDARTHRDRDHGRDPAAALQRAVAAAARSAS